jgi:hypothetical protein
MSYPMSNNMTEFNNNESSPLPVIEIDAEEDARRDQIIIDEENKLWLEREVYLANERANIIIKLEEEKLWR